MKVFKFGGAALCDADGVRRVSSIIRNYSENSLLIVVSAMGKMTNALESIAALGYANKPYTDELGALREFHDGIIKDLGCNLSTDYWIDMLIQQLESGRHQIFPQYYDQVVSIGEFLSSSILNTYLNANEIAATWHDARDLIRTDAAWQEAEIQWEESVARVRQMLSENKGSGHIITQGFIGGTGEGYTTTLGREGSDYSGAVFANILDAEGLWVWKDVPGIMTADPRHFPEAGKLPVLSYYEAIEMTYSGARVIHPKTLHPLQQKKIPLYVRSFYEPQAEGTIIKQDDEQIQYPPIIVIKPGQFLISVTPPDFTFVAEEHLRHIYGVFAEHRLKINLIQIAALSVSVVVDANDYKTGPVLNALREEYAVLTNAGLELLTIRHFNEHVLIHLTENKDILLEQWTRNTVQFLYR